jgi:tetratricopeptide (TPR) repeat protein
MKKWRLWIGAGVLVLIATWIYGETNRVAGYNNTALADAQAGNWRGAENQFYSAQVLMPDEALPYFNHATLLIAQNDWSKAEEALLQAVKASEGDASIIAKAYYNLGNLYYGIGDYSQAIEAYQQALIRNPQAENARYNLELAMRRAVMPTQTPASNQPPASTPTPPPNTNGDTPTTIEGNGDIIELLPTTEPIGAMSVEEAENLLNQLQIEEQALSGVLPPPNDKLTLPEKDW